MLINSNIEQAYLLIDEQFSGGVYVVLMISFAKLYSMSLGNNGAMISNSKYYKILLPYAIGMALSVYFLNDWLIDALSMNGAALSTLLVIVLFNTIKLVYVYRKFDIQPYTKKTLQLLLCIVSFYILFSFWNFSFHPMVNIALKSLLIGSMYSAVIFRLQISVVLNAMLVKIIKGNQ